MLILSRRIGEKIVITPPGLDTPITLTITSIKGDVVRLGLEAPSDVGIDRQEVYDDKLRKKQEVTDPKFIPLRRSPKGPC